MLYYGWAVVCKQPIYTGYHIWCANIVKQVHNCLLNIMILRKLYPEGSDSLSNSSWMSLGAVRKTSKTTAVTKRRRRRNHEMLGYSPASCWSKGDWYSAKHSRTYKWSSKSLIIRTTYDRGPWTRTPHTQTHTPHTLQIDRHTYIQWCWPLVVASP